MCDYCVIDYQSLIFDNCLHAVLTRLPAGLHFRGRESDHEELAYSDLWHIKVLRETR